MLSKANPTSSDSRSPSIPSRAVATCDNTTCGIGHADCASAKDRFPCVQSSRSSPLATEGNCRHRKLQPMPGRQPAAVHSLQENQLEFAHVSSPLVVTESE